MCNCNDKSDKCVYDAELYRTTGHGGRCQECRDNTDGPHCEKCKQGYYFDTATKQCQLCGCDAIGTETSSSGFSLFSFGAPSPNNTLPDCDVMGQCKCKPRVGGRTCDRCLEGYFGVHDGCKKCDCDPIGCTESICDPSDGRCLCKPGVTGEKCNKCMDLHYGFSATGCSKCDCDTEGSLSSQCDENGQCQCKTNLEGSKCDRCKENMHNKQIGCEDCGPCYQIVQLGVEHHRKMLKNLTDMINNIENSPQTIQDPEFNRQLLDLINKVDSLASQAEVAQSVELNLLNQLDNLAQRIKKIRDSSEVVSRHLDSTRPMLDEARDNVTSAENILKRIQDELLRARNHIRIDGQAAILKANERSQRLGEHYKHISEMAKQSRAIAEDHRLQAETILSLANQALRNSSEAYNLAKDAVVTHEAHAKNIQLLNAALKEAVELMERTQKMSIESNAQAKKAYEEALALFTAVKNLELSPYDLDKLRNEANDHLKNARRLQTEVEEFLKRHRQLLDSTFITMQEMKDLLEETRRQQQITDKQLADIDKTIQESKAALASGEKILKDGMDTLKALKEFDVLVERSRLESVSALKMIPQIRKTISDAENKTREAEGKLATALEDATDARDIARNAFEIANKTTIDAQQIRSYASELKDKSTQLRQQTKELSDNVNATDAMMTQYENVARVDGEMSQKVLRDANQAAISAQNATDTARFLLNLLGPLLKSIDEMEGINPKQLADLESLLANLKKMYADSGIKNWLEKVQEELTRQKLKFKMYEAEIEWLKNEVANIREIRDSLPDKCFKRERLEVESANSKFSDWNSS